MKAAGAVNHGRRVVRVIQKTPKVALKADPKVLTAAGAKALAKGLGFGGSMLGAEIGGLLGGGFGAAQLPCLESSFAAPGDSRTLFRRKNASDSTRFSSSYRLPLKLKRLFVKLMSMRAVPIVTRGLTLATSEYLRSFFLMTRYSKCSSWSTREGVALLWDSVQSGMFLMPVKVAATSTRNPPAGRGSGMKMVCIGS